MGLPQYTGPFSVGAIDLEIPVRNPQSFGTEFVSNDEINKPKKKSKVAHITHQKAKRAAHQRHKKGGSDVEADEAKHNEEHTASSSSSPSSTSPPSSSSSNSDDEKSKSEWNPFTGGATTTTLHLSTVLFTLFYPSEVDKNTDEYGRDVPYSNVAWMGRPKRKTVAGFLQYMGMYGNFAYVASPAVLSLLMAKIPAIAGARLADPSSDKARASQSADPVETGNFGSEPAKFPLVIFSHGLAGSRLSYSQFCGELASHGVIVAAMEHRDGSGISSLVRLPQPNSPSNGTKAGSRPPGVGKMNVPYFAFERVGQRSFAEDPSEKETGLRAAQIAMRSAEIMECLHIIQEIDRGKGEEVANSSTRNLTSKLGEHIPKGRRKVERSKQEAQRLKLWKGKVDSEYPCLAGHSFGACTVIEMQRKPKKKPGSEEKEEERSPFPFSILLDPWVEPIQWRGEGEEPDPRPMMAPAFAINSESFTIWRDHFSKLKRIMHDSREVVDGRHGWLFTLCGCQHLDFSDFPFLLPHIFRSTVGPKQTISVFCRATYSQMGLIRQRRRDEDALPGVKTDGLAEMKKTEVKDGKTDKERISDGNMKQDDAIHADSEVNGGENDGDERKRGQFGAGEDESGNSVSVKSDKDDFDKDPKWSTSPDDLPLNQSDESQLKHMSTLKEKKSRASDKIWLSKKEREKEERLIMDRRRKEIMEERKKRGLRAVFANRSPSGNIALIKDGEECIDFSETAKEVAADEDADKVHKSLEDISRRLEYKKPKVHSLMAFLFRLNGLHPGLSTPGKVLIHQY